MWVQVSEFGRSFPGSTAVKNLPAKAGEARDLGSIPGWRRSTGAGNGNLLQYSCLENPMNTGAWHTTVHGVTKNQTQLSDRVQMYTHTHTHTHTHCPVGGSGSNHVLFAWLKSGLNGGLHLKMLRCQNFPGMLWRIASMLGRIIRCTSNFHPWCTHLWGKTCEYGRMSLLGLDSVFLKGGMCQIQLRLLISWLWVHQNGGDPEQAWSGLFRGESNYSWDSLSLYTMKKSRYRTGRV